MDQPITEKTYPIQGKWILKSVAGSILTSAVVLALIGFGIIGDSRALSKDLGTGFYILTYGAFLVVSILISVTGMMLRKINFHYTVERDYLTINQGVISKSQVHIPYGVIQNILVAQDLFDRLFGVADLRIQNATQGNQIQQYGYQRGQTEFIGVSGNTVEIPGLLPKDAQTLKQIILGKVKSSPVDPHSGL